MPRVAFVIASHSGRLAQGVVELADQMAPEVHFGAAGGTDEGGIGTSTRRSRPPSRRRSNRRHR